MTTRMDATRWRDIARPQTNMFKALRHGQRFMSLLHNISPALYQRVLDEDAKRAVMRARDYPIYFKPLPPEYLPVDPFYEDTHLSACVDFLSQFFEGDLRVVLRQCKFPV